MSGGLGCGSRMAKFFLFLFNIIFWLIGAVILGVGIWVLADDRALKLLEVASVESSDSLVKGAAITFIVIGLIVFVTGFLGCCGALKESACMLLTYAIIVGFILFLQIVAGIMGAVFKDKILAQLDYSMNKTVIERYTGNSALSEAYDFVQKEFKCCGALNGPDDWADSTWRQTQKLPNGTDFAVPLTCCPLVDVNTQIPEPRDRDACFAAALNKTLRSEDVIWMKGCRTQLGDWIKGHAGLLIGIAFGLAAVEVFGIVLACCLRSHVMKGYETV